jgi:hypothetical protein
MESKVRMWKKLCHIDKIGEESPWGPGAGIRPMPKQGSILLDPSEMPVYDERLNHVHGVLGYQAA